MYAHDISCYAYPLTFVHHQIELFSVNHQYVVQMGSYIYETHSVGCDIYEPFTCNFHHYDFIKSQSPESSWSHVLIVSIKVIPTATRNDCLLCKSIAMNLLFCHYHLSLLSFKISGKKYYILSMIYFTFSLLSVILRNMRTLFESMMTLPWEGFPQGWGFHLAILQACVIFWLNSSLAGQNWMCDIKYQPPDFSSVTWELQSVSSCKGTAWWSWVNWQNVGWKKLTG